MRREDDKAQKECEERAPGARGKKIVSAYGNFAMESMNRANLDQVFG